MILKDILAENGIDINDRIAEKKAQYKAATGQDLTDDEAIEELVAEFLPDMIADPESLKQIADKNPGFIRKLADFIKSFIDNISAPARKIAKRNPEAKVSLALSESDIESFKELYNGMLALIKDRGLINGGNDTTDHAVSVGGVKYSLNPEINDAGKYSYKYLTSLPDMKVAQMPPIGKYVNGNNVLRREAMADGYKSALIHNSDANTDTVIFVDNKTMSIPIQITKRGMKHSFDGSMERRTLNANIVSIIGDIISEAIPVNELKPRVAVAQAYLLAGIAEDADYYYPINLVVEKVVKNKGELIDLEVLSGISKHKLYSINA